MTSSPVQVKHLIEYLSTLPPDMDVELDKDGWMEDELPERGVALVKARGVFREGKRYLIINN